MDRISPIRPPCGSDAHTPQQAISVEQSNQMVATPFSENQPSSDHSDTINKPVFQVLPSQKEIALKQLIVDGSVKNKRDLEVRELKRVATSSAYAKNLAYAEIICKRVRGFVPLGTNTASDALKKTMTFTEKVTLINILRDEVFQWVDEYKSLHNGRLPTENQTYVACTEALKKHKYGHCGELTKAAFVLAQNNPDIAEVHYCFTSEGRHSFTVIGKRNGNQWDASAAVCDPWAEKCYSVAEFHEMQKPENDVKYAEEFYREENLWLFSDKLAPRPYLSGKLEVKESWIRPQ